MSERNVGIVRNLFNAWARGDLAAFRGALDNDVEWWQLADNFVYGQTHAPSGCEALGNGSLKQLRTDWEAFDGVPTDFLHAGDRVVVLGHYVGTYKLTGKEMQAEFVQVYTLKDAKVVRWRQCVDTKALIAAMNADNVKATTRAADALALCASALSLSA